MVVDKVLKSRTPRPFVKWAGGKAALLPEILRRLPKRIDLYVEPFIGGGAVFLELARQKRIRRAIIGDRNPELVLTWRMVQTCPEEVIEASARWKGDEGTYYRVRDLDPATLSEVEQAARVIWLNRNCFNGLYRLNSKGRFNVPFGRYAKPQRVDYPNLRRCSEALQGVEIVEGDFETIMGRATGPRAAVYCDPPYWPLSETARFNYYDGTVFGPAEQHRLNDAFRALKTRRVYGLLSNSSTPETRALYHGLKVHTVEARRSINRDGSKRGPVDELLVELA